MLEKLKFHLEIQKLRIREELERLEQMIDEKAWQDKDLQMSKAEFLAEYNMLLGKLHAMDFVLYEMEMGDYA